MVIAVVEAMPSWVSVIEQEDASADGEKTTDPAVDELALAETRVGGAVLGGGGDGGLADPTIRQRCRPLPSSPAAR